MGHQRACFKEKPGPFRPSVSVLILGSSSRFISPPSATSNLFFLEIILRGGSKKKKRRGWGWAGSLKAPRRNRFECLMCQSRSREPLFLAQTLEVSVEKRTGRQGKSVCAVPGLRQEQRCWAGRRAACRAGLPACPGRKASAGLAPHGTAPGSSSSALPL